MSVYRQHGKNRSVGWSQWHLQWCTKYRYKVFYKGEYKKLCEVLIYSAAEKHGFEVYDCEVDLDHVHVLVSLPLTMTPNHAIHKLKGRTARGLFIAYPHLRRMFSKGSLWSPGKFMGSIGHITLETAKKYFEAHHAKF